MSNVRSMRLIAGLLAALLLALVAGCGKTGVAGSAASAVPGSAVAYVSVDTSFEGDQWRTVAGLLGKFPDGEGLLEKLLADAAAEAGLEGDADLRAALGPELALVVLDVPSDPEADPPVVILTKPGDEDAFAQLLEGEEAAHAEVRGWQAVAPTEAELEHYREALEDGSLEDSGAFAEAMDDLPGEALARVYVNGQALVENLPAAMVQPPLNLAGAAGSVGAALVAEDDGVRLEGHTVASGDDELPESEPFVSSLVDEVPAGAVAFFTVDNLGKALTDYAEMLGGTGPVLPFDPAQVGGLLSGEVALYVRPGPTITLVAEVDDEAAALRTVETFLAFAGGKAPVVYDAFDGLLAVSNSQAELDALRGDGPRLDQDDRFQAAREAAGMPDETVGFGYVDVRAAIPLVAGLSPLGGEAAVPGESVEPLGGLVFWGETSGAGQRFTLFLGID